MAIYENIKKICSDRNISINELESKVGLSRSSICKWNKNIPSVNKIKTVADELNVKIEKLLE